MSNEVEIVVRATDKTADGVESTAKHVRTLGKDVDDTAARQRKAADASKEYGKGLEGAGEKADVSEQRIMGARDTIDGLAAIMQGPGQQGISAYLQGWADLASGVANGIVPALQAFSLANLKAAASTAASKVAMVATSAATKAWAAAQWLLNVALTANPIGLVVVAIAALVGAIILAYKNSETFRKICDAAFKAIGDAVKWLVDKAVAGFKVFWESIKAVWDWFKKLTGASDDAKEATDDVARASQNAADSYRDQADAMDELSNRLLGLVDGELGLEEAIDNATKSLKENGQTLDRGTEKGRNNEKALNDIIRATLTWRKAAQDAGKSQEEQAAITEQGRRALIKAQIQMGASADEARDYADQILGIPTARSTKVELRTPNLATVRHNFNVVLRDRVVNVRVVTTGSTRIADNDKYTGGIIGAMGGGPRGRQTLVGEYGPEIVDLPVGSMVHSNPDSMRMLGQMGGGGGGGVWHVTLQLGDRILTELLLDPVRKIVRTVGGGDVQATFGAS